MEFSLEGLITEHIHRCIELDAREHEYTDGSSRYKINRIEIHDPDAEQLAELFDAMKANGVSTVIALQVVDDFRNTMAKLADSQAQ